MKTVLVICISFALAAWAVLAANVTVTPKIHFHDDTRIDRNGSNYELNMYHKWSIKSKNMIHLLQELCREQNVTNCGFLINKIDKDVHQFLLHAVELLAFYDKVDIGNITQNEIYNITAN